MKKVLGDAGLIMQDAKGVGSHNLPSAYRAGGRRFCFVRQPFEWYWSIWRGIQSGWPDKREVLPLHSERSWSPIRMLTYLAGERNFPDFLKTVMSEQPGFASRMFEWYVGPPGSPQVQAVGRMENLVDDLAIILQQFGFKGTLASVDRENDGPALWPMPKEDVALIKSEVVAYNRFYTSPGPFFVTT